MYKYTCRQTEIKTYRHTQTNRQTDVQKDKYAHIWYIPTVLYIRQTYRQTDRTDRKE